MKNSRFAQNIAAIVGFALLTLAGLLFTSLLLTRLPLLERENNDF